MKEDTVMKKSMSADFALNLLQICMQHITSHTCTINSLTFLSYVLRIGLGFGQSK